jgi:hypothetical protein
LLIKGDLKMVGTDNKGTASSQDRARQPKRATGGNVTGDGVEQHGQAKATRIKQGGAGDQTTGKNSTFGLGRDDGGNVAKGVSEKHSSWGRGKSRAIPSNVEVADRTECNGNCASGTHEENNQKKAKQVKASQRFDA